VTDCDRRDAWDPMHVPGSADSHYITDNIGEAAPGVLSPLAATTWPVVGCSFPRRIAYEMGVFDKTELAGPGPGRDRLVTVFFGRMAMEMEYLATVGDRMPGTSGEDAVRSMFGRVPESMTFAPTRRRYPIVAYKLPRVLLTSTGNVRKLAVEIDDWWRVQVARLPELDHAGALGVMADALARFDETIGVHSLALLSVVQPLLDGLTKLVATAGVGDVGELSGTGGAEMAIISDIWSASRGQLSLEGVIANHGFHGPLEGEISSRVWREDPAPLERMISEYAARDEAQSPVRRERTSRARLPQRQREVLAALPRIRRPGARLLLTLAARILPTRGIGKRSYLQTIDVARGAARRIGQILDAAGRIDDPEDVFYLTRDELFDGVPPDAKALVAERRRRRAEYQLLRLPAGWKGVPEPEVIDDAPDGGGALPTVTGIGVSSGVVEGVVRVVHDPSFAEVEPGEVLVTPTTDPSWASIMFLSSALVVDIGGALSHAAVVARELGVPCVVNTRTGTRQLRTGDHVRVDGKAGTVEVLERAELAPSAAGGV
jgi:phosphohistidine swiveling domain-containing protein